MTIGQNYPGELCCVPANCTEIRPLVEGEFQKASIFKLALLCSSRTTLQNAVLGIIAILYRDKLFVIVLSDKMFPSRYQYIGIAILLFRNQR